MFRNKAKIEDLTISRRGIERWIAYGKERPSLKITFNENKTKMVGLRTDFRRIVVVVRFQSKVIDAHVLWILLDL